MSPEGSSNPFVELGPPPPGNDPEQQLQYLRQVVGAFEQAGNPRLRPLRSKLNAALLHLAQGAERGADPQKLAQDFALEVEGLKVESYDLLLTVINQVRATLRVKLQGAVPSGERIDTEQLQKALALFAQALRKLLSAAKKGDRAAGVEAAKLMDEAGKLMSGCGHDLQSAS